MRRRRSTSAATWRSTPRAPRSTPATASARKATPAGAMASSTAMRSSARCTRAGSTSASTVRPAPGPGGPAHAPGQDRPGSRCRGPGLSPGAGRPGSARRTGSGLAGRPTDQGANSLRRVQIGRHLLICCSISLKRAPACADMPETGCGARPRRPWRSGRGPLDDKVGRGTRDGPSAQPLHRRPGMPT